jgi:hypothetical protein
VAENKDRECTRQEDPRKLILSVIAIGGSANQLSPTILNNRTELTVNRSPTLTSKKIISIMIANGKCCLFRRFGFMEWVMYVHRKKIVCLFSIAFFGNSV